MNKFIMLTSAIAIGSLAVIHNAFATDMAKEAVKAEAMEKAVDKAADAMHGSYKEVTPAELKAMIESEKSLVIIDSNYAEQYKKEHIKGAIHLTPDAVTKESMAKVAPAMDTPLAFYCYNTSCPASKKAATKAAELGYSKVYKLPLGIEGWKKEGYSVDTM